MKRMTLSIPDALMSKVKKEYPEINWAEVARSVIIRKLNILEDLSKKGLI